MFHQIHATSAIIRRFVAIGLLAASGVAGAADASFDGQCQPQLTRQQQRVFDKAAAGIDQLRDYLVRRRFELQLDVYDTAVWAEGIERQRTSCLHALTARTDAIAAAQPAAR